MRRGALVAVAVLLLACSDSKQATSASAPPTTEIAGQTTIVIGPDGSSTVVDVPETSSPPTTSSCAAAEGCAAGGAAPPSADPRGAVGSYGATILNRDVTVELRTQAGADPDGASVEHLVRVLGRVGNGRAAPSQGAAIGGGAKDWSAAELRSLGDQGAQPADDAVIHLLYVHGTFEGNDGVLGAAVQGDTAAIFIDRIHASATPVFGSAGIETAVTTHEVGHLLGLVDLVLHSGRQDPDHPGHSTNTQSVMYWAVESSLIGDVLTGGPPTEFDSADLADLAAIRRNG